MRPTALHQARNQFIRRWGEMGATWGISRTMAEVHALLFIAASPLCTDDVMEQLEVSRGNASMNLRNLANWGLIRRTHVRGDRKDYYVSDLGAWEMFETIARERRRREVEPIIETIERCRELLAADLQSAKGDELKEVQRCDEKLGSMLGFINVVNTMLNVLLAGGADRFSQLAAALTQVNKNPTAASA